MELLVSLWPVGLRIARLIWVFRRNTPSPDGMCQFELAVNALLREVGRLIVQWTVHQLEPADPDRMPRELIRQKDYYRRRWPSPARSMNCLFGPIHFVRYLYQPIETAGRSLFPLEVQLGIVAGVATPALADLVARLSADMTQRQVLEALRRQQGIGWGPTTLRKVVAAVAQGMGEHRCSAQVQAILGWMQIASERGGGHRFTLSVGRDGCMLPMRNSKWYREGAAATVSVLDGWGKRLGTVYLGRMPEPGQCQLTTELTTLLTEVLRQWTGIMPRLIYVTDCGSHPTQYFEQVLAKMTHPRDPNMLLKWEWVADYYHACVYITKLAEIIFGGDRAAWSWAAKQRRVLKTNRDGVFRVLRSAGALKTIRGLVGSEEDYENAYAYLRQRVSTMRYAELRQRRLPIGSGVTEAACKILFTQRMKQSGMKWETEGGASVLLLRTILLSGVWTQTRHRMLQTYDKPQPPTRNIRNNPIDEKPSEIAA
jgi:hypothetical protein